MYKVVIDTNSLIDAEGDAYNYSNRIIDNVISGNIKAYANRATLRENQFIAPQKLVDQNYLNKLKYFFDVVQTVESKERLNVVTDDEEDNKILESAVAADADYLITSDRHLLKIGKFKGIDIVRPEEFWNIYQDETSDGWGNWMKTFIK